MARAPQREADWLAIVSKWFVDLKIRRMSVLVLWLAGGCYASRLDNGASEARSGRHASRAAGSGGRAAVVSRDAADGGSGRQAASAGNAGAGGAAGSDAAATEADAGESEEITPDEPLAPTAVVPAANLRVAFLGDQGLGLAAWDVLELLAREKPALVVHAGDLSYSEADPLGWEANINQVLGRDFPYLVAVGNHDLDDWYGPQGFAALLQARLSRTPGLRCNGELGVKSLCRYRGLELVLSGVGSTGTDHEWYLERTLVRPGALVRLCVWHMNQHDMQVGTKTDEVGWGAYQICARHGAPIITAHEHSYARTLALTAIGDRTRAHGATGRPDVLQLGADRTFVVVTGLGGHSSRPRTLDHAMDTWWASIYANDYQLMNGTLTGTESLIQFGALFIDFHVDGDPRKARAYFKTTEDKVVDRFELHFDPTDR